MWYLILALAFGSPCDIPAVTEPTAAFESFFQEEWVPAGVAVLGTSLNDGILTVDVSEEILNYGGNAFEAELVAELAAIAATVPGAEHFSLTIEGQRSPLAEGYIIEGMSLQQVRNTN